MELQLREASKHHHAKKGDQWEGNMGIKPAGVGDCARVEDCGNASVQVYSSTKAIRCTSLQLRDFASLCECEFVRHRDQNLN